MSYRHSLLPYSPFSLDALPPRFARWIPPRPHHRPEADDRRHAGAYEKRQTLTAGTGAAVPIAAIAADRGEATP